MAQVAVRAHPSIPAWRKVEPVTPRDFRGMECSVIDLAMREIKNGRLRNHFVYIGGSAEQG